MIGRRRLIGTAAAAALLAAQADAQSPAAAVGQDGEETRLRALLDAFMQRDLERSPEDATTLGLDVGALAPLRARLDDRSLAQLARDRIETRRRAGELAAIDRSRLGVAGQLGYDTALYVVDLDASFARRFDYGAPGSPYVLSQLDGAYQSVPDFLDTEHPIESAADAEAWLARLSAFAVAMDDETERVRHDAGLGVGPPDFVLGTTLEQMKALAQPVASSPLVASLARRTAAMSIPGDWSGRAGRICEHEVLPALARQMSALEALRAGATHQAGVARLPGGPEFYAHALRFATTSDQTPDEIHRLGLDQTAELSARLDTALRAQGLGEGALWTRLRGLFADPRFLYPNTDAGKAQLIGDLNAKVDAVQAKLPDWFGVLPKAKVVIRRVPPAIEAGASSSYEEGSLDGSRPGVYYIVLRDTGEDPSWLLPTLTFHESIPGHHLQGSVVRESGLPLYLKEVWFSGYGEGWAHYAEQLADEMGLYAGDPWGRIGYLHDALLRAVRLVIDTGIHARGWSREQAIQYFVENQGDPASVAETEVDRYCVGPGQACSYTIGKLTWLRLRNEARRRLGARFDIRRFHDAGLLAGALPLGVLERAIDRYVAEAAVSGVA